MPDSLFCLPRPALARFRNQITNETCYKIVLSSKCFKKALPHHWHTSAVQPVVRPLVHISAEHVRRDFYSSINAEKNEWQQSSNIVSTISGFLWILKHVCVSHHFVLLKSSLLLVNTESNNINPNINWACKMELVSLLTKVCRRSEMSIRNMKGLVGE